jgi:beta-lactam-binding protein with PASTA domain
LAKWIRALAWAAGFWVIFGLIALLIFDKALMPLVVGKHKSMEVVPNVVGMMPTEASQVLKKAGFQVSESSESRNSTLPKGMVMLQVPAAGLETKEGRVVQLVLSKGVQEVLLPQLKGSTLEQARTSLNQLGLRQITTVEIDDPSTAPGIVIETVPAGGVSVGTQTSIQLTISKANSTQGIPSFIGQTRAEATAGAGRVGMQAAFIEDPNAVGEPGRIVDQNPVPGAAIQPEGVIQFVVVP